MILRPVRPQSPCGPPTTKRPVGFTRNLMSPLISSLGRTGLMICSMVASRRSSRLMSGECWVDSTTVSIECGLAFDHAVREVDRQRHQRRGFVAGVAEHQALVAGALAEIVVVGGIDTLSDIRALIVVGEEHG